jgi:hypothetical protein
MVALEVLSGTADRHRRQTTIAEQQRHCFGDGVHVDVGAWPSS